MGVLAARDCLGMVCVSGALTHNVHSARTVTLRRVRDWLKFHWFVCRAQRPMGSPSSVLFVVGIILGRCYVWLPSPEPSAPGTYKGPDHRRLYAMCDRGA